MACAFVVAFSPTEQTIDNSQLSKMLEHLAYRGGDGGKTTKHHNVVMGTQCFWTTPEDVGAVQPLSSNDKALCLVFDGRLDNRAELYHLLPDARQALAGLPDADLVLRLYRQLGKPFVKELLGSFAFALYDKYLNTLLCARDATGDRTLFYSRQGGQLLVASEESALLAHPQVRGAFNERRLLHFLTFNGPALGDTFFADIAELTPGSLLVFDDRGLALETFWQFEPSTMYAKLTYGEYAEEFRFLLEQSVRCRLRAYGEPASTMSGGLDSTPVAALAAKCLAEQGKRLHTYSWCFDQFPAADEREYIEASQRHIGTSQHWLNGDDCWQLTGEPRGLTNRNTPERNLVRALKQKLYSTVSGNGHRVLLSSASGDLLYSGMDYWLASLFRYRGLSDTKRAIARIGVSSALRLVLKNTVNAFGIKRPARAFSEQFPWLSKAALSYLEPGFPSQTAVNAEAALRTYQVEQVLGSSAARIPTEGFYAYQAGIDMRDPYRDRRLISFMLSVPDCCLMGADGYKQICRDATIGLLPDVVRYRTKGADLSALVHKGLAELFVQEKTRLLASPGDVVESLFDMAWLEALTEKDMGRAENALAFWHAFLICQWQLELHHNVND